MCLQYETEDLCPAVKVADNPLSTTSLAIGVARIDIVHPVTQCVVKQHRDLWRGPTTSGRRGRLDA